MDIQEVLLRLNELEERVAELEKTKRAQFKPPALEEVLQFFKERKGRQSEAMAFWNHYEANGWMVGRNKMKKWHNAAAKFISYKPPRRDELPDDRPAEITPAQQQRRSEIIKQITINLGGNTAT